MFNSILTCSISWSLFCSQVFTRDIALCTPNGYIKLRMGLASRRDEEDWMASILDSISEPCVGQIKAPGTVEGGDIIHLPGNNLISGISQRTNQNGITQIQDWLQAVVKCIEDPDLIHLKSHVTYIKDNTIVVTEKYSSHPILTNFEKIIEKK